MVSPLRTPACSGIVVLSLMLAVTAHVAAQAPRIVPLDGTLTEANGLARTGTVQLTFALYDAETGGAPMWTETQKVGLESGRYRVLLGATTNGLPAGLFASGTARWLGIEEQGIAQPRIQLLAVPYAVAAADAAALGGTPAAEFVTVAGVHDAVKEEAGGLGAAAPPTTTPGTLATVNYIPMFASGVATEDSIMTDAAGNIGIGIPDATYLVQLYEAGHALVQMTNAATGSTAADGSYVAVLSGDRMLRIMNQETAGIELFTNNARRMTIDPSGNVGIGTTERIIGYPLQMHSVAGHAIAQFTNTTTGSAANDGSYFGVLTGDRAFRISNQENAPIEFYINGAKRMSVTPSGNLEIGYPNSGGYRQLGIGVGAASIGTGDRVGIGENAARGEFFGAGVGYHTLSTNSFAANDAVGANAAPTAYIGNTAVGESALANGASDHNTAIGRMALASLTTDAADYNTAIGWRAGANQTTGDNNTYVGHQGVAGESATTRVGTPGTHTQTFIAGIRGVTTMNDAVQVLIDSNGQLGTLLSSRRFKDDIRDIGTASDSVRRLRPVAFRYIAPYADGSKPLDWGLIAEEVAEVLPDLVVRDAEGRPETVQYHKLSPLLLGELRQQARAAAERANEAAANGAVLDATGAQIEAQQREITELLARIAALKRRKH